MWPYEDGEYSEHFFVSGVQTGVSGFTARAVDTMVEQLTEVCRPTDDAELAASSIIDGHDVTGSTELRHWRTALRRYPDDLATAVLRRELVIDESWWSIDLLAARNERPAYDMVAARMRQRVFRLLLALNRRYLIDPKPKWAVRVLGGLDVTPAETVTRWSALDSMAPRRSAKALQELFDDVLDGVEQQLKVDLGETRRWFRHRRPAWDAEPPGL